MTVRQKQGSIKLDMPVQYLKGVGPARAKDFARLGVETVEDLLEHYPRDWVFAPEPTKIAGIKAGDTVTLMGVIESTDYQAYRRGRMFEALLADDSGICRLIWFHGGYLRSKLEPGRMLIASGKVGEYKYQLQLTNPKFMVFDEEPEEFDEPEKLFSGGVYPAGGKLSSNRIKTIIRGLLDNLDSLVKEYFSEEYRKKAELISRPEALRWIHLPPDEQKLARAKRRLKYDELFLMQLALALRRYRSQHIARAVRMRRSERIDHRIRRRFPFMLTEDQDRVIEEIVSDMNRAEPMNRLLQGDVGSGKTVVALYAALLAVANKKQVAIMAPTEILASQHFDSIEKYLAGSDVQRVLITGGMNSRKRTEILRRIGDGQVDIVVGTVALLQEDVDFSSLGLVVIDEQHKFGVHQRAQLRRQSTPHCLVMTATPIPRTLAMTAFGDLDVSLIKHCPPGRGKVITRWVDHSDRSKAEEFIRSRLRANRQAYFVYPRIDNLEENGDVKAATEEWHKLNEKIFSEFEVGLLHGRMRSQDKRSVMERFRRGKLDALVSTVVIEVGVDVPNATIMVIEGADRFGLAQLHQLRGRIGRGEAKSYCFLFAETRSETANERLEVMTRTNDGFEIAEEDLKLRGPGELFSARQHGLPDLKIANIVADYDLLVMARRDAFSLVERDPMLQNADNRALRRALINKFGESLGLGDVA